MVFWRGACLDMSQRYAVGCAWQGIEGGVCVVCGAKLGWGGVALYEAA